MNKYLRNTLKANRMIFAKSIVGGLTVLSVVGLCDTSLVHADSGDNPAHERPADHHVSIARIPQVKYSIQTKRLKHNRMLKTNSRKKQARVQIIDGIPQLSQLSSMKKTIHTRRYLRHTKKFNYHTIALKAALSRIGSPYMWGSTGPNTFDCSGLIVWAYKHSGITLPRSTWGQMSAGKSVHSIKDLQPADLVITDGGEHVGMYIGNGKMVHAPESGDRVKIVPVNSQSIYAMRHI